MDSYLYQLKQENFTDEGRKESMRKEVCQLCNKTFSRLATHLKRTHKVELIDYYREYDRERYLLELEQEVINQFYISYRRQYLTMDKHKTIYTVHKTLTDAQVKQHIRQGNRLGIKFGAGSKIIGLDIDSLDIDVLEDIYTILLNYGIPSNAILKSFSGNKGYHIDIFLENFLDRQMIQKFYKVILNDAGYKSSIVELRGGSDAGYFLPFSINYKGEGNKHWGYCGIVNKFGLMYYDTEKEIDILEGLGKVDASIIRDIVDINYSYIDNDIELGEVDPVETLETALEQLELLGIYNTSNDDVVENIGNRKVIQEGTRHNIAFVYAIALRENGLGEQEVYNQLISWHKQVKGYSSTWKEVLQDIKGIVKSVFKRQGQGYRYNLPSNYKPYITKQDIEKFASIESIAQRRIYLVLAIQSNMFRDAEGHFYMTYKQIKQALGINTMNSVILSYIEGLEKAGLVQIVERNRIEEGQNKHKPNIYKVIGQEQVQEQDRYYISSSRKITRQEVERAIEELFTIRQFRGLFKNKKKMRKVLECLVA